MLSRVPQFRSCAPALLVLSLLSGCDINLAPEPVAPTTVELTPPRVTLSVGDSTVIRSSVQRADRGGQFDLSSLSPEVATVSSRGLVRALRPGTALVVGVWTGRVLAADTSEVTVVP